jgi:hypothetical protein
VDNVEIASPACRIQAQPLDECNINAVGTSMIISSLNAPKYHHQTKMNLFEASLANATAGPTTTLLGAVALVVNRAGAPLPPLSPF